MAALDMVEGKACGALRGLSLPLYSPVRGGAAGAAPSIVYPPDQALLAGDGALNVLGFLPGGSPGSMTVTGKSGPAPCRSRKAPSP